jgi:pilus assembly protein CpaB
MRWIVSVGTLGLVGLVVGLGLGGLFRVQTYLNHRAELYFQAQKELPGAKVSVTERRPRSLDNEPTQLVAGEIDRPAARPAPGDATAVSDVTGSTERNAPAAAIPANEANRTTELTRPHRPIAPTANLGEGKKAVAIRVTNVESIAGFLVPGQPVDVVLTRQFEGSSAYNEVVTQDARMLAKDQLMADRNDSSSDAHSVVIEVDITDAQKLLLASQVGTLSLILRNAGEPRLQHTRRIGVSDLAETGIAPQQNKEGVVSIRVNRAGATPSVYVVPRE